MKPKIWLEKLDRDPGKKNVIFNSLARGADRMMVSSFPDFHGSEWINYKPRMDWTLPSKSGLYTVYAVFMARNEESGLLEISPIEHYTIDTRDFSITLEKTRGGYINWSDASIIVEVSRSEKEEPQSRTANFAIKNVLQRDSQRELYLSAIEIVLDLPIYPNYSVKEKMLLEKMPAINLYPYLENIRLVGTTVGRKEVLSEKNGGSDVISGASLSGEFAKIDSVYQREMKSRKTGEQKRSSHNITAKSIAVLSLYDEERILLEEQIRKTRARELAVESDVPDFGERMGEAKSFYHFIKPLQKSPQVFGNSPNGFFMLVIDVRGFDFRPSLFPAVTDSKGSPVLNASFYDTHTSAYVRYVRSLENIDLPRKSLLVRAYDVNSANNTIELADNFAQILLASKDRLKRIANGNFILLVD